MAAAAVKKQGVEDIAHYNFDIDKTKLVEQPF